MVMKAKSIAAVFLIVLAVTLLYSMVASPAEKAVIIPAAAVDNPKAAGPMQTVVLSGGCFWGVQAVYQHVQGVRSAVSGYAGGTKATADYDIVSLGQSGHAESVQVTFDPKEVSIGQLLQIYFSVVHDPTQLNRQDPDVGTQYRSNIFYSDESQKKIAEAYIAQLNKAKVYPTQPYIAHYDIPKLENLKKVFPALYRGQPVLVKASK